MAPADITALTAAFDPSELLTTFIGFATFILLVVGIVFGVQLVKWGIRRVSTKLSRGV